MNNIEIEQNIPHQTDGSDIWTIIWLHGLGADGNDFLPLVSELQLPHHIPVRFIFPNAPLRPITINNGYVMPGWYDIHSFDIDKQADKEGILASKAMINRLIDREIERGVTPNRIILGGFSQGAVMALNTGLHYPQPLAGIIALSGYLPHAEELLANCSKPSRQIPIFIAHGSEDTLVHYSLGQSAYQILKTDGFAATWHTYPIAHSVSEQEISDISQWISKILTEPRL